MPSVSIWLSPKTYKYVEELANFLTKKPNRLIKEIIENKIVITENIESYYNVVKGLYKWYYYQGEILDNEKYIRRVLKRKNAEAILNIINLHDDIRVVFKTLGVLMLIVSLKSYAKIPEENFSTLKLIKYDLMEEVKRIRIYSLPLLYSKILWLRCVEKIRELSILKTKDWEKLAFTAAIYAVTILGEETPDSVYSHYNLKEFEKEWSELIKSSIKIMTEEENIIPRCTLCKNIVNGSRCSCGNSEIFYDDLNI